MSRTSRREPTSRCWLRRMRCKPAWRGLEASADALRTEGIAVRTRAGAVPRDPWDDVLVSYRRGQAWSRT